MAPDTRPFLSGRWLHPALRIAGCKSPLKIPIPKQYTHINIYGEKCIYAHSETQKMAVNPPIAITGLLSPLNLSIIILPKGKKILAIITIIGYMG